MSTQAINEDLFNVTESAHAKIIEILSGESAKEIDQNIENVFLRVAIEGGGCKGMQYALALDNQRQSDDFVITNASNRIVVVIDSMSLSVLTGGTLDFYETIGASAFKIINPNAKSGCGCGNSFST